MENRQNRKIFQKYKVLKQNFNINHYQLKRDTDDFYNHITNLIDIILNDKIPIFNNKCSICIDTQKNLKVMELDFI